MSSNKISTHKCLAVEYRRAADRSAARTTLTTFLSAVAAYYGADHARPHYIYFLFLLCVFGALAPWRNNVNLYCLRCQCATKTVVFMYFNSVRCFRVKGFRTRKLCISASARTWKLVFYPISARQVPFSRGSTFRIKPKISKFNKEKPAENENDCDIPVNFIRSKIKQFATPEPRKGSKEDCVET